MTFRHLTITALPIILLGCASGAKAPNSNGDRADSVCSVDQQTGCTASEQCVRGDFDPNCGSANPDDCIGPNRCVPKLGEDGTYDDSSGIGCIFGDHLVTMARVADLETDDVITIDAGSSVDALVLEQILETASEFETVTTLAQAIEKTDDGEILMHKVHDRAHERHFNMYVWYAGDNITGRIYYSQSMRLAAEIGDGDIANCDAGFSNFDDLPWFYTN